TLGLPLFLFTARHNFFWVAVRGRERTTMKGSSNCRVASSSSLVVASQYGFFFMIRAEGAKAYSFLACGLPEVAGVDLAPSHPGGPSGPETGVGGGVAAGEAGPPLSGILDSAGDIR